MTGSYKIPSGSTKTRPVSPDCIFSCTKIHLVRETNVCPDPNLAFVALFCVALCCVALGRAMLEPSSIRLGLDPGRGNFFVQSCMRI